jgi:hypothetical protein
MTDRGVRHPGTLGVAGFDSRASALVHPLSIEITGSLYDDHERYLTGSNACADGAGPDDRNERPLLGAMEEQNLFANAPVDRPAGPVNDR